MGVLTHGTLSAPARAEPAAPKLEILPATAKVFPNRKTQVLVVVRNTTSTRLSRLELSWYKDAVVSVEGNGLKLDALGPNSEHAWVIELSAPADEEFVPGTVHFRLDYSARARRSRAATGVALGSVEVQSGALEDADQVADVRIETTLESLTEQTPGKVYIVVTNKTNKAVAATVTPTWPYGIKPEDERRKDYEVALGPHQSDSVGIGVKAKERVRPGKYLLTFDVKLAWKESGQPEVRHKIVTQPVDVGVLGESQILTLLGVPSFLLLPGFLVLLTIKIVWSWGLFKKVKGQPADFPWEVKSAEFAFAAITISIPVTFGYSLLWQNLLDGYGLRDIIAVWFLSVFVIGFLGYAAVASVYNWHWRRVTPSREDQPITFLEKLGRRGLSINLERADFRRIENNQETVQRAFLLEPQAGDDETIGVAPQIGIQWTPAADDAFKERVREQLRPGGGGDPSALAKLLRMGTDGGQQPPRVVVLWRPLGRLDRPNEFKRADMLQPAGPARIVVDEEEEEI